MDSKKLDALLEKYWACETSLEEEAQLKEYFLGNDIPEQHKETAALFQYFKKNQEHPQLDESFDGKVLKNVARRPQGKIRALVQNTMRIAAGVAVLMLAIWFVRKEIQTNDPVAVEDTYSDPKLAFEETKKALMMISKSFGRAEEEAKKINLLNEAKQELQNKNENTQL